MPAARLRMIALWAAFTGFAAAPAALAEDLALILDNHDYITQPDLPEVPSDGGVLAALDSAGFETIVLRNEPLGDALRTIDRLRNRLDRADHVVFYLNGHVARSDEGHWLLAPDAHRASALDIGTVGLPIGPLLALAGDHPGAALVAVTDPQRPARLGAGLAPGLGARDVPQGVTLVTGRSEPLARAIAALLDRPDRPVADVIAAADGVTGRGYLPELHGFGPALPHDDATAQPEPEPDPEPSPEERLAQREADLGLNRAERRQVQEGLARLGFNPRGIDGVFGPGTRAALRDWQAANGYPVTGYLNGGQLATLRDQAAERAREEEREAERQRAEEEAQDTAYWRDTGRGRTEAGARAYLERYPDGLFAGIARARLETFEEERLSQLPPAEREAWTSALDAGTAGGYRAYLDRFPDGAFAEEARARMVDLEDDAVAEETAERLAAAERAVIGNALSRSLVETRLASLGLDPGPADGAFDDRTRAAIRQFQESRGLPATGYVDQATVARLLIGR